MKLIPHENITLNLSVSLPISKSIRARELVLDAICGRPVCVEDCNDDIYVLSYALNRIQNNTDSVLVLDVHDSATALRFLTAFCSATPGRYILCGSKSLSRRPISELVDVLVKMGADIKYAEKEACIPLKIEGRLLNGGTYTLDAGVSSQYISAIMLVSSFFENEVNLKLRGRIVSSKYIDLTKYVIERYKNCTFRSDEKDWSSATIWYSVMALVRSGKIIIKDLILNSFQPDRGIVELFSRNFGVVTKKVDGGLEISCNLSHVDYIEEDCVDMPDSVLYIVVTACLLGISFKIKGLWSLKNKESDRIDAICSELKKFGYVLVFDQTGALVWDGIKSGNISEEQIETHKDHRMAMAMSLFGLFYDVEINDPFVVCKSYPNFWNNYSKIINIE